MTVVSQILIADQSPIPEFIKLATESVKKYTKAQSYELFNHDTLRDFIKSHFEERVVAAYDLLKPYAYKADLGRYCLLYVRGGWYFDISVRMIANYMPPENCDLVAFRDRQIHSGTNWACSNTIIYSRPHNEVFNTAIDKVVENCRARFYGITPLCPTGPTLFGSAMAQHGPNRANIIGDMISLTPNHLNKNNAFVLPDGEIVALCKPGDLGSLGLVGTNNYNDFWHAKRAFGESRIPERRKL